MSSCRVMTISSDGDGQSSENLRVRSKVAPGVFSLSWSTLIDSQLLRLYHAGADQRQGDGDYRRGQQQASGRPAEGLGKSTKHQKTTERAHGTPLGLFRQKLRRPPLPLLGGNVGRHGYDTPPPDGGLRYPGHSIAATAAGKWLYNGFAHEGPAIMTTPTKPHTGMRVSVAEFLELELPEPDHKRKMELDDGALYIMPRPPIKAPVGANPACSPLPDSL